MLVIDVMLVLCDGSFQRKCVGKIGIMARKKRKVLLVSHNMQAVESLCSNALLIDGGRITATGNAKAVVARYLDSIAEMSSEVVWPEATAPGNNEIRLKSLRVLTENATGGIYSSSEELNVEMEFTARSKHSGLCIG